MDSREYTVPAGLHNFTVEDSFWSERMETVRTKMIPYQWRALNDQVADSEPSHCIQNFRIAAGMEKGIFEGCVFQDSDVAKWLEAAGYVLSWHKDEELERTADEVIDLIVAAQQPDGYMDTYYIINGLEKRWTNLMNHHELYCAGHMIEAGIGYFEGTGKRKLLDAVIRLSDCIDRTFGPEEGKLHGYPGHEIIEMALVRLFHVTGERRYLNLAEYFINERGKEPNYFAEEQKKHGNENYWENGVLGYKYYQADRPVREQEAAEGHAVRAVYLYAGMAAVAKETGDESLWKACVRLWNNVVKRQLYITGAVGSSEYGEAFSYDYDLPNDLVYGETCASAGLVFWAQRMLGVEPKSEYADVMELALFNTCLSGMSLDGTKFFYVNPLEVNPEACRKNQQKHHVEPVRQPWFCCACCPPNLARLLASLGNYAVSKGRNKMYLHLYAGGSVKDETGRTIFRIKSGLPWNGNVEIRAEGERKENYCLAFRIPGWTDAYHILLNKIAVPVQPEEDGYVHLKRDWVEGDCLQIRFSMPVHRNHASPAVHADIGKVALSRGPLVYCLEEKDNGAGLPRISLNAEAQLKVLPNPEFEGTIMICGEGEKLSMEGFQDKLYSPDIPLKREKTELKFIPYYLWNNRGEGEMTVWVRQGMGS